jgi:hypothetical protein
MKTIRRRADRRITHYALPIVVICAGILMAACAKQAAAPGVQSLTDRIVPPANVSDLLPGLAVRYYEGHFRHIDQMPSGTRATRWGRSGNPIAIINHRFGEGNVFDSGVHQKVGVMMSGYIHFENSGSYRFRARSNDGVRIWIGDTVVIDDPDVHPDQLSDSRPLEIRLAGWYPFQLKYFQNKGSATLELYWQPPGAQDFTIVPEAVYRHHP